MAQTFTAYLNLPFTISCSAFDPDTFPGVGLVYSWIQISGPATAQFSSIAVLSPTITCSQPGQYVFQLEVTDSITPVFQQFTVNILPLFTSSVPYTAYCPIGNAGNPSSFTGLASSATSASDATSKAATAAQVAAQASLVCAPYAALPKLQINIFGVQQIDPSITQLRLSWLSAGTPANPITETVLTYVLGFSTVSHPLSFFNHTICNPYNLLFPYSTQSTLDIDDIIAPLSPNAPLYLILRAGPGPAPTFSYPFPVQFNLDSGPAGASITNLGFSPTGGSQAPSGTGPINAGSNCVLVLPNSVPGPVNVSLQQGTFIGFDTANWRSAISPATYLLIAIPQGSLNNPTGLATVATIPMDRPSVPALAEVKQIDTFLTSGQLNAPLFLAFFAATYDPGAHVYTPIANSIQFTAGSVFSASSSAPPGALSPYSILSMSGNPSLNIPAATNGVLYFPNPKYARVVAGMSSIP